MLQDKKNACEFSSEVVDYMYNELTPAHRERFETHLADCTTCIDEFAAVSSPRYDVYEWRKIEFDPLETPVFEIPYEERPVALAAEHRSGWFEVLAGMLAVVRTPMFAGAAAVVVVALGFGVFMFSRPGERQAVAEVAPLQAPAAAPAPAKIDAAEPTTTLPAVKAVEPAKSVEEPKVVKASSRVVHKPIPQPTYAVHPANNEQRISNKSLAKKAPKLGDLGDEDEDGLRLADLLDGFGG